MGGGLQHLALKLEREKIQNDLNYEEPRTEMTEQMKVELPVTPDPETNKTRSPNPSKFQGSRASKKSTPGVAEPATNMPNTSAGPE